MKRVEYRYSALLEELLGTEVSTSGGSNAYIRCPFHDDRRASFAVNTDNGLWLCNAGCGEGMLWQLVAQINGLSMVAAQRWIYDYEHGHPLDVDTERLISVLEEPAAVAEVVPVHTLAPGLVTDRWPNWWPERGFNAFDWRTWQARFDPLKGDVVLPIFDRHGAMVGEVRRRMPGSQPKYLYSEGFHRREHLFGEWQLRQNPHRRVAVVEGSLDCIWLWHHGWPAAAVLGSSVTVRQLQLLEVLGVEEVVLAFDNDDAGRKATLKTLEEARDKFRMRVVDWRDQSAGDVQEIREQAALEGLLSNTMSGIEYMMEVG